MPPSRHYFFQIIFHEVAKSAQCLSMYQYRTTPRDTQLMLVVIVFRLD